MITRLVIFYLSLLIVSQVIATDQPLNSDYTFQQFQKQFGRTYQGDERELHRKAFYKNYQELLNIKAQQGADYQVHVNNFTDFTDQEKKNLLSYKPTRLALPYDQLPAHNKLRAIALPQSLNYTAQGKITSVKNQGKCGSCWAFTTTAMYESQLLLRGVGQFDLAEQYVLECTDGGSCDGGWPNSAITMFAQKGIPLESAYPYKGEMQGYNQDQICSGQDLIKLPYRIEQIKHYNSVPQDQLRQILLDHGPVSVGMKASDNGFLYYGGGVFSGCQQNTKQGQVDHVVLLVGWTKDGNWIIKNSWGKSWGERGYGIINRARNCGISHFVDVLSVSKVKIDTKNPQVEATPNNQIENLKVKMTDSFGDGWNGYVLGVRQQNSIVTVFGQQFKSGSQQGPIEVEIKSGIETQIVVVVVGKNPQQIGFSIQNSQGKQLCKRMPGSSFADQIIFCSFCEGCESNDKIDYQLTLYDAGNNGWNGNILSFKQDGILTTFGEQFIAGQKYGPRKVEFTRNLPVQIWPSIIGEKSEDIGFEIRDSFGNIVFSRAPGTPFSPDTKIGDFCPGCKNLFQVNYATSSQPIRESFVANEPEQTSLKPFIAAISVLSVLVVVLSVILGIVIFRGKKMNELISRKESFPGASILVSTATIPDEIEGQAKSVASNQEIKLN